MKVQPNRYLPYLSFLSEGSLGKTERNPTTCSIFDRRRRTIGEKVRRKFRRQMEFFLVKGGLCSYDDESIGDIEVPPRYKHRLKQWVPKELPPLDTDFSVNNRMYRIARYSLHGLGIFSMDGITIKYNTIIELMNYVGLCYNYNDWMLLV